MLSATLSLLLTVAPPGVGTATLTTNSGTCSVAITRPGRKTVTAKLGTWKSFYEPTLYEVFPAGENTILKIGLRTSDFGVQFWRIGPRHKVRIATLDEPGTIAFVNRRRTRFTIQELIRSSDMIHGARWHEFTLAGNKLGVRETDVLPALGIRQASKDTVFLAKQVDKKAVVGSVFSSPMTLDDDRFPPVLRPGLPPEWKRSFAVSKLDTGLEGQQSRGRLDYAVNGNRRFLTLPESFPLTVSSDLRRLLAGHRTAYLFDLRTGKLLWSQKVPPNTLYFLE